MNRKTWVKITGVMLLVGLLYAVMHTTISYVLSDKFKPSISAFIGEFYSRRDSGDFKSILNGMVSEDFNESYDEDTVERYLELVYRNLGDVISWSRSGMKGENTTDGEYWLITTKAICAKGSSTDRFLLKKKDGGWELVRYAIIWSSKDISKMPVPDAADYEDMRDVIRRMMDGQSESET